MAVVCDRLSVWPMICTIVVVMLSLPLSVTIARQPTDLGRSAAIKVDPERVYILAVGSCAYWIEKKREFCGHAAPKLASAIASRMGVPADHTKVLLDKEADYDGLLAGLRWLSCKTEPGDTIMIIVITHGSQLPDQNHDEKDKKDEILDLYSKDQPPSHWWAVNRKIWMIDDEFNLYLRMIPAERMLLLIDACHSGTWIEPPPQYQTKKKVALITSARDNERAWLTKDGKWTIFANYLTEAIENGAGDLLEAFKIAEEKAIKESRIRCKNDWKPPKDPEEKEECIQQTPGMDDPHGLIRAIKFKK
jgi:hypothetical protein